MRFVYANPPVIRCGAGEVAGLGAELDRLGAGSVAIVTTRSLRAEAGVLDAVRQALGGRPVVAVAVVGQHAPTADLDAAVRAAAGAGAVVSVGGGSAIDAGKIVALLAPGRPGAALPHVAVPTTLSVAELAAGAGYTDAAGNKAGMADPAMLPAAVIYDAALTLATPLQLWLSTGIRAVDHAVEGFLAEGEHPLSDVLAAEALRRLLRTLREARARPEDLSVRTENQLAAWFAYTLPAQSASGLSHVMGKAIGARYGIPHGVTSCLLLPHVMRHRGRVQPERMALLGAQISPGGEGAAGPSSTAGASPGAAAGAVEALIRDLGLPQHIAAYGIGEPELRQAAESLSRGGGGVTSDELLAIYLAAL
jgi:alcohol dehydrogenase class IV